VIDNSRKYNKPMEITLGHKFKLDCWETCLKTMRLGEIAKFSIDADVRRLSFSKIKSKHFFPI
jgi:FKBP-type peptidyl-prolyl cis-trans isomerase